MTRACVVAVLLCAAAGLLSTPAPVARAQVTGDDSIPFRFRPVPPGFRLSSEYPRWMELVEQHQPGVRDAAAQSLLAKWTSLKIGEAVASIEHANLEPGVASRVKRAVLLHTDVATFSMDDADTPDAASIATTASLHFGVALELVNWLAKRDRTERPFVLSWYRLTGALLSSHLEVVSAPVFFRRALGLFPDDADLLVMAGAVQELLASPRYQEMADASGWTTSGSADDHLRQAEALYPRALAGAPSFAEARLRLGRVIGLQGRHEQALEALTIASDEELPDRLRYFLCVFIGDEEGALNRPEPARRAYERAIALRPEASFAWLALSRTERLAGHRTDAVHAVERMLAVRQKQPDPWSEYYSAGLGSRPGEVLEEFRQSFRRSR